MRFSKQLLHACMFIPCNRFKFLMRWDGTLSERTQTTQHGYIPSLTVTIPEPIQAEYLELKSPWCSDPSSNTFGRKAHKPTPRKRSELQHSCQVMTHLSIFSRSWALSMGGSYRTRAPSSNGSWRGRLSPARLTPSERKPRGPEMEQRHSSNNNIFLEASRAWQQSLITLRNSELIGCWSGGARSARAHSKPKQGRCLAAQWEALQQENTEPRNRGKEGVMVLLTQGGGSSFLKAKEGSRMYISTAQKNTLLHIKYAGWNSLLGSPDLARLISLMQGQERIFNSDEVLQHHRQYHIVTTCSGVLFSLCWAIADVWPWSQFLWKAETKHESVPFPSTVLMSQFWNRDEHKNIHKNPFSHQNSGNCAPRIDFAQKRFSLFVHCLLKLLAKQECTTSWGSNAHTRKKEQKKQSLFPIKRAR